MVAALIACEVLVIITAVVLVQYQYYKLALGAPLALSSGLSLGVLMAAQYLVVSVLRRDYHYANLAAARRPVERVFNSWSISVVCLMFVLFMTKSGAEFSRGSVAINYFVCMVLLCLLRRTAAAGSLAMARAGRVAARTMMLVGTESEIARFYEIGRPEQKGIQIVGTVAVNTGAELPLKRQFEAAVEIGRRCCPEEIVLLFNWKERELIQECLGYLLVLPAAIGLCPESFHLPVVGSNAPQSSTLVNFPLARKPLSALEIVVKRLFDLTVAGLSLLVLSPLLGCIALAIRLETRGPVLFRQKRYGFNRTPFEIYKFRSMYVEHLNERFRQAARNDTRITRVGSFIRKLNLDELPQLVNVIKGEMSLVGPRPHPVDLDDHFTSRVTLYARRHNVLPGITGWAQVNGLRGVTDEEWKMRDRVLHDLYYLDNWSVLFDIRILMLTVLTAKAFTNAA